MKLGKSPVSYGSLLQYVEEYQPKAWSLRGARMIEPVCQGDYDGLCGLYCIINAVRLVAAPYRELSDDEVKSLFKAGVTFLSRRGTLSTAVHSAVGETTWPHLVRRITEATGKLADLRIELATPFSGSSVSDDNFLTMERLITAGQAPMVYMRGKYRHYSVISGYTPASFKLFDSFGYRWVRRASCSVAQSQKLTLHRFHVESLIALSATSRA